MFIEGSSWPGVHPSTEQGELTWVADECISQKSISITPPVSRLTMRSCSDAVSDAQNPVADAQECVGGVVKWLRRAKKASGPVLIFRKARLQGTVMASAEPCPSPHRV